MADNVINFTRGVPPVDVFPTQDLIRCTDVALRRDPSVLLQYGQPSGYQPLREWLANRYDVGSEQVFVGNGSLEVFSFIAQTMMPPGDRAFLESPVYDRAITLLNRAEVDVVGIPLEEDGVNIQILETELKRGAPALMYVVADFQNPMGTTMSLKKRKHLAALAEEYDFWIVEDGPYRPLRYWGQDVPALLSIAPDRVLHMSSFSKVLAPGLRVGYVVGPASAIATITQWAVDSYIGPVLPTQGMVNQYCREGLLDRNIERLKEMYKPRLQATISALEKHVPQCLWTQPEGGFFIGVTLPEGSDIEHLVEQGKQIGLKLADGRAFFPHQEDGNQFLRIPFCSVTPSDIEEGIRRLATIL